MSLETESVSALNKAYTAADMYVSVYYLITHIYGGHHL